MTYASNTNVPIDRSKAEIERVLQRYGASTFGYGWQGNKAVIMFTAKGRAIRMELALPTEEESAVTSKGRRRRGGAATVAREQEIRRRWRALSLVVKAKLEAVASGIATFENEFLPYTILPSGETFAQWAKPQLDSIAESGQMPKLLMSGE